MARTRISISLDEDQARRIREHAERAGMDVSAYLVNAAIRQIAETAAAEAQFARVDHIIAEAEAAAADLPPLPEVTDDDLTEEERRRVQSAVDLVLGRGHDTGRGGAAA
ncbi:plasmid mobilization protein [Streptomyces aidingensis]|uniref:Ribbon-helix-helix protein, copG family n=1 Tax=Streptomyces aidingensis TaxID=910347 RepID=A0A1I1FQ02_9ACTN|nr:ribbon-helix-helix protein, CopG family [Streptomyces aidingensis]SFC01527.1 Ribbon-helix-helix protein, copG family [Streptomyces aidingensis]